VPEHAIDSEGFDGCKSRTDLHPGELTSAQERQDCQAEAEEAKHGRSIATDI